MIQTISCSDSFSVMKDKFEKGENFSYVRFGDGDLFIMFDKYKNDCQVDGTVGKWNRFEVTKKLQDELKESFNINDENYMVASVMNQVNNELDMSQNDRLVGYYIDEVDNNILIPRQQFYHHFMFIHSFVHNFPQFKSLVDSYIKPKNTMYVSGFRSKEIDNLFGVPKYFVETPKQNSYENIDEWYENILYFIDDTDIVLLGTGFSSRVIAKRLWNDCRDVVVLDLGSIIDGLRKNYNRLWLQKYQNVFEKFND